MRRPSLVETTALGAAGLAGLAAGVWGAPEEFAGAAGEARTFLPEMDPDERRRLLDGWRRAVEASRAFVAGGVAQH